MKQEERNKEETKEMVNVRLLFNINPEKFRETAKGKTFDEFIEYLHEQGTFEIINYMTDSERKELYTLSAAEEGKE